MPQPSNRLYRVWLNNKVVMCGNLSQCYEQHPILATMDIDEEINRTPTILNGYLEKLEW